MKKLAFLLVLLQSFFVYSQEVAAFRFETLVPDAEKHYVILPKKESDKVYPLGFIYLDNVAGYTYRSLGSLELENGNVKFTERQDAKNSFQNIRIGNLNYKLSILSKELQKKFNMPDNPDWLKYYYDSKISRHEEDVNRASFMNGARASNLALPILLDVLKVKYRSKKLYFETSFAYNALGDFSNAEKIAKEAIDTNYYDDHLLKEYVYALLNQKKITETEFFMEKNIDNFKIKSAKIEAINNLVAYGAQNNHVKMAKKWLQVLKKETAGSNFQNISVLENIIKENDK